MKKISTFLICWAITASTLAQWSNTNNQFYDSLYMPVSQAVGVQSYSFAVRSYPDSGYFVIWQDGRDGFDNYDIYAQKYDKLGNALWTNNGVPVVAEPDKQSFRGVGSLIDYRGYSYACTDSANGFFIAWTDENNRNSSVSYKSTVNVQHLLADGSRAYGNTAGQIISNFSSNPIGSDYYAALDPQLIPNGRKGCFIGFKVKLGNGGSDLARDLYVYDFQEENGQLVRKNGGKMDADALETQILACGFADSEVSYTDDRVSEFQLYPNWQAGCNIIWLFERNNAQRGSYVAFNSHCKVKKNCRTRKRIYGDRFQEPVLFHTSYAAGSTVKLYSFRTSRRYVQAPPCVYTFQYIDNYGYASIDNFPLSGTGAFYHRLGHIKGTVVKTGANMDYNVITYNVFTNYPGAADQWIAKANYGSKANTRIQFMQLININGMVGWQSQRVVNAANGVQVLVQGLPRGVYVLYIKDGIGATRLKLIRQ
jgi:hypothetical protein